MDNITSLQVADTKVGTGARAVAGQQVIVHYTGWLYDPKTKDHHGKKFDSSRDLGINFFATADMYSRGASEEVVGRALGVFASRDQVVIATKVFNPMGDGPNDRGLSRKHVLDAIDASLRRLGVDYVDLYQIHRFDPETPIDETLEALHDIVKAGKARY